MNFETIRNTIIKEQADAAFITSIENRFYFTRFNATDGCYYLITPTKTVLFADSRYIEAAGKAAVNCDEILLFKTLADSVKPVLEAFGVNRIITESERMTVSMLGRLNKACEKEFAASQELDDAIDALRSVKCDEEVALIKKAQGIAEKAFDHILTFIKPGVTEREIGLELDYFMLRNGADALSFETIAVSGANSSLPHGVPTDKKIVRGDFITMDYGAVCGGYHSDMTRTIAVGEVSDEQRRIYETVLKAQLAAFDTIKAGVACRDVDAAARAVIENAGYGENFGHGLGHGVGVEIHEAPTVSPRGTALLEVGNIITNEPGIYLEGKFGVRIEDMALVTETGYVNLTTCTKELIVL